MELIVLKSKMTCYALVTAKNISHKLCHFNVDSYGAGGLAQKLRVLVALAEDQGSIPRTHIASHKQFQFQGTQHPLLTSAGTVMHVIHTYTHMGNMLICIQ